MRPSIQTLVGSASVPVIGTWVPLSLEAVAFNALVAGLAVGATQTFTWSAQYTLDDPVFERFISGSQTTTVITVTSLGGYGIPPYGTYFGPGGNTGHGLIVGDSVTLKGCGSGMDGTYNVATVPSATTYTVTSAISQSATIAAGARETPLRVITLPSLNAIVAGTTARAVGAIGLGQPQASASATAVEPVLATAVRPIITAWTAGNLDFIVLMGMGSR